MTTVVHVLYCLKLDACEHAVLHDVAEASAKKTDDTLAPVVGQQQPFREGACLQDRAHHGVAGANAFFATNGIAVTAVMTDNGACYRSHAFAAALDGIQHRRTRPYRPQTNGKVERFNRALATEWAYAETYSSDADRAAIYDDWLHSYNHHRPHTARDGQTPAQRVHNVTGKNT